MRFISSHSLITQAATFVAANSGQAANSAFVFMVHSLMNKFKEVVHIVPVHKPNAEFLHKLLREVICGLEKIGFKVICVVTDNNAINRKAMLPFKPTIVLAIPTSSPKSPTDDFVFPHPCDAQRPLCFCDRPCPHTQMCAQ